ncbi:branched-chain amino acid ABC transporter permease [Aestuariirhabdus sp. Z084]|uniref:branched-chain amino acid ABC transporter permease n=1 Tax=Aestuariirhabdus haliotis TaxID=2918751 RepID=UPI00201B3FC7|nr:branched-chain amino acid ABC transporter permease [Aestuariirhabdus haliotis]MCL6417531.1 branched-chain amino acid ABC transporter permease [Aestuariirhabdus haliotis]MCL6421474.1 branched-chain amino acid ABC transporter permease [Aestuariirhabdus haliotis]
MLLFFEQLLNGLQLGFMLFLMAAGLTLVFGIMGLINLAHGSLYMIGAYGAAAVTQLTGSFLLGMLAALLSAGLCGLLLEIIALRRLYDRDHLDQVLATFGLILFFNELTKILFGPQPLYLNVPDWLNYTVELIPGAPYPAYRLAVIGVGLLVAIALFLLVNRTRLGMLIRAGASNREMVSALGINIALLYSLVFALGAMLAGLSGALVGPLLSVEVGMGEGVLILTFVVIVIGGIGSIKGALIGALLVGLVDTLGRAFLPSLLALFLGSEAANSLGASLASIAIYLLMAIILIWRPAGLFPAQ